MVLLRGRPVDLAIEMLQAPRCFGVRREPLVPNLDLALEFEPTVFESADLCLQPLPLGAGNTFESLLGGRFLCRPLPGAAPPVTPAPPVHVGHASEGLGFVAATSGPGKRLGGLPLRGVGVTAVSGLEVDKGFAKVGQPGFHAAQKRAGIGWDGGGHRFSLRPQAGQAQRGLRRDRGPGVAGGKFSAAGGGAGVDDPAGPAFG